MGRVFDIQHFCVSDGPGIRTTVFLKGCPLGCAWCHNPESKKSASQLMLDSEKCVLCGSCAAVCRCHQVTESLHTVDFENCTACGKCAEICPAGALEISGRDMSAEEVVSEAAKDMPFYRESGGLTISGGEPLFQPDFTLDIAERARARGIRVCVETSGFGKPDAVAKLSGLVQLFLWDIKLTDDTLHKKYTGVSNSLILENLRLADSLGAGIILRCPVIPGVNDNYEHYAATAKIALSLKNARGIELEPYHSLGVSKALRLGGVCAYNRRESMQPEELKGALEYLSQNTGLPVKIS